MNYKNMAMAKENQSFPFEIVCDMYDVCMCIAYMDIKLYTHRSCVSE